MRALFGLSMIKANKDSTFKAKAKAKDSTFEAKDQGQGQQRWIQFASR